MAYRIEIKRSARKALRYLGLTAPASERLSRHWRVIRANLERANWLGVSACIGLGLATTA